MTVYVCHICFSEGNLKNLLIKAAYQHHFSPNECPQVFFAILQELYNDLGKVIKKKIIMGYHGKKLYRTFC